MRVKIEIKDGEISRAENMRKVNFITECSKKVLKLWGQI